METYIRKLRHILPVFLAVTFGTVFGLGFIRWIFCIQFAIIDIKEEIWNLWLPILFPWIPTIIWLRPRFRILTFKSNNDNGRVFFLFISWGMIAAMTFNTQAYLTTSTGDIQALSNIQEIDNKEKARYYKLKKIAVAPYYVGSYTDFSTSGRRNQYLTFKIYFVLPILKETTETITPGHKYWYGLNFKQQISNKISTEEKEDKYQAFYNACLERMNKYNYYYLDHFERKPNSDDRANYFKAIEAITKETAEDSLVVLEPKREKYEERNGNKLAWIFGSFGIGLAVLLFFLIWTGYSKTELRRFLTGKKPKQDDLAHVLNFLNPKDSHFASSIILDLNIVVFLIMIISGVHIFSPSGMDLLQWGANRRFETISGEWWRLLTSVFLHGGILHLFLNLSGLVMAAIFVEPFLGRKKYFILYILSGICGSLASIWWYPNTISIGASGAIMGLYGAMLGLFMTNTIPKDDKKGVFWMIGIYVGINLLWGLSGVIDNAAHIGGLVSGTLMGLFIYKSHNLSK